MYAFKSMIQTTAGTPQWLWD